MGARELLQVKERFGFQYATEDYRELLAEGGLRATGLSADHRLVEIMEVPSHPFMVGVQFHPEFLSRPNRPHPLFRDFLGRAKLVLREGGQHPLPLDSGR